jgi:hypothetical protein
MNIGEFNSGSNCTNLIYKSWFTTFVQKSSLNYALKLHSMIPFDNLEDLDYALDL